MLMSPRVANRLVEAVAENMYAVDPKLKQIFVRPLETRGVPHGLVPGVHAALDDYESAMQCLEGITGSSDRQCKLALLVLPMARYTQSLAPHVDPATDFSQKLNLRPQDDVQALLEGRAFLPDQTLEADAVCVEPHVSRP